MVIISRLKGGLGNQLFCYSAGLSMAIKYKSVLQIEDKSAYIKDPYKRKPELHLININYKRSPYYYFPLFWRNGFLLKSRIGQWFQNNILKSALITESNWDEYYNNCPKKLKLFFLDDYFQQEKFFSNITSELYIQIHQKEFDFSEKAKKYFEQITSAKVPVCIHARRLYTKPAGNLDIESASSKDDLSIEYYKKSISLMLKKHPDAHFFAFSDYPKWFENVFDADISFTIVELHSYGSSLSYEEFILMQYCKHFIISNSTFSWWAAKLATSMNTGTVISPDNTNN